MALKVCAEPGCPELTPTTRCQPHTRARDIARGTRQQRGYDRRYDQGRKRTAPLVDAGKAECWRCGKRISPLEVWHYGHCDDDRSVMHGVEHEACNLGARGACPHGSHTPGG